MHDWPDKTTFLEAIARFLSEDLRPVLAADPRLQFRALIAANLATIVAAECKTEEEQDLAELLRLAALLPDLALEVMETADRAERRTALGAANAALAARIRGGRFDEAGLARVTEHVMETLREKLSVVNPRFDLSLEVEP